MSDKKYVVPEEGLKAARDAVAAGEMLEHSTRSKDLLQTALEAFIRWQSESPRVPSVRDIQEMVAAFNGQSLEQSDCLRSFLPIEWQRRMYLAPEPEVPEEIKDLLVNPVIGAINGEQINDRVLQAFQRGKASR